MAGMRQQGASTLWERATELKVTWTELWRSVPQRLKFLDQAVYDVLPSPSNLFCWGKVEFPACVLCLKKGTLDRAIELDNHQHERLREQASRSNPQRFLQSCFSPPCKQSTTPSVSSRSSGEEPMQLGGLASPQPSNVGVSPRTPVCPAASRVISSPPVCCGQKTAEVGVLVSMV